MILVALAEYIDAAGDKQQVLLSTHPYSDPDLGQAIPCIVDGTSAEYRSRFNFFVWGDEKSSVNFGTMEIINENGMFDHWADGNKTWRDRYWEVRKWWDEEKAPPWNQMVKHFRARLEQLKSQQGLRKFVPSFYSSEKLLDGPVQIRTYPLSTPNESLRGAPMPMLLGVPKHVLVDLYNEQHVDGWQYFVGDNFNGFLYHSGGNGGAKEGLATIPEGAGAGTMELWKHGFIAHSEPSYKVTGLYPLGPRKRLIHWLQAHLAVWQPGAHAGTEQPEGWDISNETQAGSNQRWIRRYDDQDKLHIHADAGSGAFDGSLMRLPQNLGLQQGQDLVLRLYVAPVDGWSNRVRLNLWQFTDPTGGSGNGIDTMDISADDADSSGMIDIPFESLDDKPYLGFRWGQHPDDESAKVASELRVLRVQLLPVIISGSGSLDGIMHYAHEFIPYELLERGKNMFDGLPPDFEAGPYHATQIHYEELYQVSREFPQLQLGDSISGSDTHAELTDRILRSIKAARRQDRDDVMRFATFRTPEYFTGDAPVAAPVWDTVGQKTATGGAGEETLVINSPDTVSAGDGVVLFVFSFTDQGDAPALIATSNGFVNGPSVFVGESTNKVGISMMYKLSKGNEPPSYLVNTLGMGDAATLIVSASRVSGLDPENPIAQFSTVFDEVGTTSLTIPGFDVERDESLVVSAAIGFDSAGSMDTIPDTPVLNVGNDITTLGVGVDTQNSAPTGDKVFESDNSVFAGIIIAFNAPLPKEADIFSDRFQVSENSLDIEFDLAPNLSTSFRYQRNYAPMSESEMADQGDFPPFKKSFEKEWRENRVDNAGDLHPMYRGAVTAKPIETLIVSSSNVYAPFRSMIRTYDRVRRFWPYTAEGLRDANFDPGRPGILKQPRPEDLIFGKQIILRDVRDLPMAGEQEIEGWG